MAKQTVDLGARLKAAVADRNRAETELQKEQAKLRKIDRQADPDAYAQQLAKVNELKGEIGRIAGEHAELARAVALVSGGTNHTPQP